MAWSVRLGNDGAYGTGSTVGRPSSDPVRDRLSFDLLGRRWSWQGDTVEFYALMAPRSGDPVEWARRRHDEGYAGVGIGDHIAPFGVDYPHLWITLTSIAIACPSVRVVSTFANNLLRSPVEFAQAALTLHAVSDGRFDAGIGAGWAEAEITAIGAPFPSSNGRARRYQEAVSIVRALFDARSCRFNGEHYQINQSTIGVTTDSAPPLMVSVGGPWTIEHVSPLADIVEIMPLAHSYRQGHVDITRWADGSPSAIPDMLVKARQANRQARLSLNLPIAVGTGTQVEALAHTFGQGPAQGLAGSPQLVAETLLALRETGLDRISLGEALPGSYEALAPHLTR